MATLNEVRLIGNLTKDPESRAAGSHTIVGFSIAVNRKSKGSDGQAKEEVSFFDCEAWNKTGELVMQYCKKGRQVLVCGRLQQDRWESQEGQKRSKVKVVADNIQFLGAKPESDGGAGESASAGIGDPDAPF
ncbi:MAG TPA: single-stranded DNA-binding protein [Pyrinomonadaceae bacterium]|jgi:single-strand DNA-binding protein